MVKAGSAPSRFRWKRRVAKPKTTILIVDADASMRDALRRLLLAAGFSVMVFDCAEAILANLPAASGACALVDVHLRGIGGIELCRQFSERIPPTPTILVSSRDEAWMKRLMREAKPVACLFKPFDRRALLRAISKATKSE
jgi:FixJ family two-component response regulator